MLILGLKMKKNLTIHYSLLHFFYQVVSICIVGYSSYYLLGCGFKNTEIGIIVAVSNIIAVILLPMIGSFADKPTSPSLKNIMLILYVIFLAGTASLFILNGRVMWLTCIVFGICSMMFQILMPLLNSLGTESLNQGQNISIGAARGTGSLAYAIVSYILGIVVIPLGITVVPVFASVALIIIIIGLYLFPFNKNKKDNGLQGNDIVKISVLDFFKKYPSFTLVLIGCICFYINHTLLNNFLYQIVSSKNGTTAQMGTATAIAAILELPIMFGFHYLLKKVSAGKWILICGVFYTIKALGSLLVPNMLGFYFVQVFQMFSWAVIAVATVYYVNSVMEKEDTIKGQSYMGMTFTIGTILGSVLGGVLLDYTSVNMMLIAATIVSMIGIIFVYKGIAKKENSCSN